MNHYQRRLYVEVVGFDGKTAGPVVVRIENEEKFSFFLPEWVVCYIAGSDGGDVGDGDGGVAVE